MMKNIVFLVLANLTTISFLHGQHAVLNDDQRKSIYSLIDQYSKARETRDTILLKNILTTDIDQLVSTGEWRNGINSSVQGMLASSSASPGARTLKVDKIRPLTEQSAIVDCKYIIQSPGGTVRTMWSTFVVLMDNGKWKISAIRNMLPSGN